MNARMRNYTKEEKRRRVSKHRRLSVLTAAVSLQQDIHAMLSAV